MATKPLPKIVIPPKTTKTSTTGYGWEGTLANLMGIPYSTDVKKFFDAWNTVDGSAASNNPFNITIDYTGTTTGDLPRNGAHVKIFPTALDGLKATALFIQKRTPFIIDSLKNADFKTASDQVQESGWAPNDPVYGNALYDHFVNNEITLWANAPTALSPADKAQINVANQTTQANIAANSPALNQAQTAKAAAAAAAKASSAPLTQAQIAEQTAKLKAEAGNQAYIGAETALAEAKVTEHITVAEQTAIAKQTAHITDPWVTVTKDKNGNPVYGTANGQTPPANVLVIGGVPATKSSYQQALGSTEPWVTVEKNSAGKVIGFKNVTSLQPPNNVLLIGGQPATETMYEQTWSSTYDSVYQSYTGKPATPAEQQSILSKGISVYALQQQLSQQPAFTSSPIYKQEGAGVVATAKQALGTAPPKDFVRKAIANNWDADTIAANIQKLPAYQQGPVFKSNLATAAASYQSIYGTQPPEQANQWLKNAVTNGWGADLIDQKLRADPSYKYSPEFQTKALGFLDAMGLYTGQRSVAAPQDPGIVAENTQGTKLGPDAGTGLQLGLGGQ